MSRYFGWSQVLPLLGIPVESTILPTAVRCSSCRQDSSLHIYKDTRFGGEWCHCRYCGFHGDMIELAAAAWKLDLPAALNRLRNHGIELPSTPQALRLRERYLAEVVFRRQVDEYWQRCRHAVLDLDNKAAQQFEQCLPILRSTERSDWLRGPGRFIGTANYRDVVRFFRQSPWTKLVRFTGEHWGQIAVLPFYDLPGRLTGFLFVGRNGQQAAGDYVYKPIYPDAPIAGISIIDGAMQPGHPNLGHTLFVINDPVFAIRLQLRWLKTNPRLLPLVCTYNADKLPTGNVWDSWAVRDRIFWAVQRDNNFWQHAYHAGGRVSQLQITDLEQQRGLNHRTPLDWLRKFKESAVSWRTAIEQHLLNRNSDTIIDLFCTLGFDQARASTFIQQCPPELQLQLLDAWKKKVTNPSASARGRTILEVPGGWRLKDTNISICEARVRITQLVRTAGQLYYRGQVEVKGEWRAFVIRVSDVRRHGLWDVLHTALPNVQFCYDTSWNHIADQLAMQMHAPEHVDAVERVGWLPEKNHFRLATFTMAANGETHYDNAIRFTEVPVPTMELQPPSLLTRREVEPACEGAEGAVFWATAALVVNNVLAPLVRHPVAAIGLEGPASQQIGLETALGLGCQAHTFPGRCHEQTMMALKSRATAHGWPAVFQHGEIAHPDVERLWVATGGQNSVVALNWWSARVASTYGWSLVQNNDSYRKIDAKYIANKILPCYLQDICRRRAQMPSGSHVAARIAADMHNWLQRTLDVAFDLPATLACLRPVGDLPCWEAFWELVFRSRQERLLATVQRHGDASNRSLIETSSTIWIPHAGVDAALRRRDAPGLKIAAVTESLALAEALDEHQEDGYWVLRRDWWQQQLRQNDEQTKLRIVT
jgi:hypothetical protein